MTLQREGLHVRGMHGAEVLNSSTGKQPFFAKSDSPFATLFADLGGARFKHVLVTRATPC